MNQEMTLYAIEGDHGLASLDQECLKSILYVKVTRAPVRVSPLNGRWACAFYSPATLTTSTGSRVEGFDAIVKHLRKTCASDIDANLTAKQKSETLAWTNHVTRKLDPAYKYMHWIDEPNRGELTRSLTDSMPYPLGRFFANRKKKDAKQLIEVVYPDNLEHVSGAKYLQAAGEYVISNAVPVLGDISTRLGASQYFFGGDAPTMLDITVYSYIAPFVKFPFPTDTINALFFLYPNLVGFVKRIDANYLSEFIIDDVEERFDLFYPALFTIVVAKVIMIYMHFTGNRKMLLFESPAIRLR